MFTVFSDDCSLVNSTCAVYTKVKSYEKSLSQLYNYAFGHLSSKILQGKTDLNQAKSTLS